jgi:hypothetical protein
MQGVNPRDCASLSLERDSSEPDEPFGYVDLSIGFLQSLIVAFLVSENRGRQGEKDGLAHSQSCGLLRDGTTDASVAILERVNCFEINVSDAGASDRRQKFPIIRRSLIESGDEPIHLGRNALRWRSLKVNFRSTDPA